MSNSDWADSANQHSLFFERRLRSHKTPLGRKVTRHSGETPLPFSYSFLLIWTVQFYIKILFAREGAISSSQYLVFQQFFLVYLRKCLFLSLFECLILTVGGMTHQIGVNFRTQIYEKNFRTYSGMWQRIKEDLELWI